MLSCLFLVPSQLTVVARPYIVTMLILTQVYDL